MRIEGIPLNSLAVADVGDEDSSSPIGLLVDTGKPCGLPVESTCSDGVIAIEGATVKSTTGDWVLEFIGALLNTGLFDAVGAWEDSALASWLLGAELG